MRADAGQLKQSTSSFPTASPPPSPRSEIAKTALEEFLFEPYPQIITSRL
jgi:hypothetical protein